MEEDTVLPRIIFLDIDGPLIPTPCYYIDPMCSMERTVFSTTAIGYVNEICRVTGAKVVFNSTHNTHVPTNSDVDDRIRTLRYDAIKWGLKSFYIHDDWRTEYPNPKGGKFSEHRRLTAVRNWITKNGEVNWIALDDDHFHFDRQYLIDFDVGVDLSAHDWAIHFFMGKIRDKDGLRL